MAKIIILDDNVDLLEMQAELLRAAGHEVTISSEGAAALAEIEKIARLRLIDILNPD